MPKHLPCLNKVVRAISILLTSVARFADQVNVNSNKKKIQEKIDNFFFLVFQEITSVGLLLLHWGMTLQMGNIAYLLMQKIFVGVAVSVFSINILWSSCFCLLYWYCKIS